MTRAGRLIDRFLDSRPGSDIAFASAEPDENRFGVFSLGDQMQIAHGRAEMITFAITSDTAVKMAAWLLWRYWAVGTWCGLKWVLFRWALRRRTGWRSARN